MLCCVDHARFPDRHARRVVDVRRGDEAVAEMSREGFWAVVVTFEGELTAVRFAEVTQGTGEPAAEPGRARRDWTALEGEWHSSLGRAAYVGAVRQVRERIAAGDVYQVNICRVLSHPLATGADLDSLDLLVRLGNPAPHGARIRCRAVGLDVVTASPELFLRQRARRLTSRPIKGTAPSPELMLAKDHAENVMIVDLVRNDLSGVCEPGSITVEGLCELEAHPGLVHLVSTVSGQLSAGVTWADILTATYPPGSVSGAPKSTALAAIRDLEAGPRGPYCGAIGWVDACRQEAELAVGIRTFWAETDVRGRRWLRFGTGAGITWHSDPEDEWRETELKAARLIGLASGRVSG
jgi:para-aminobenzoate synthetase component 1